MLTVKIPAIERYDEVRNEFIQTKEQILQLEHSLVSISKWESKWCKAFLAKNEKTNEEMIDYIRCMTITPNVDPELYNCIPRNVVEQISAYIQAPMTATWFRDSNKGSNRGEVITSELIYYWMIAQQIPFECQKWHLNRLLTLIRICGIKNESPKKMSKSALANKNASLNAARRAALNSKG